MARIPTVKLKIPGKAFSKSESRTSVTFKLQFVTLAIYQWQLLGLSKYATMKKCEKYKKEFCQWQIAKVKNYNLNVTEILDSDFKNPFPGIFNFTVGILFPIKCTYFVGRFDLKTAEVRSIFRQILFLSVCDMLLISRCSVTCYVKIQKSKKKMMVF